MSWRSRLRPATFRGVEFKVEAGDRSGGRRLVVHEFPKRDTPFAEDMGRRAREFAVKAYLIGPDYDRARDRLIAACEQMGAATLVHPTLGEHRVKLNYYTVAEHKNEGGFCVFSMEFVEAGSIGPISISQSAFTRITSAISSLLTASSTGFAQSLKAIAADSFAMEDATVEIRRVTGLIGTKSPVAPVSDKIAMVRSLSDELQNAPAASILGGGLVGDLFRISGMAAQSGYSAADFENLVTAVSDTSEPFNVGGMPAVRKVSRLAFTAGLASSLGRASFVSHDEAVKWRNAAVVSIDDTIEDLGVDVPLYRALIEVRGAIVQDLTERGKPLAQIVRHVSPSNRSSLALAHRIYQDAGRHREIVDFNPVPHPGFMPLDLKVLSR